MKSQPLSISRYSNGTLVKLSVSDSAFVSYDFDPENNTGTYTPTSITITPTFSGGVKFGSWRYSTDGATFQNVVSGQHGFTINGGAVILAATSDLYATTNSAVIVACVGDDPTYFDTVTIMRYVDPTFVFRQTSTAIKQTNDKISLIATDEQLERYGQNFTALDDLQAQIDVIPSQISLAVSQEHTTVTGEMNSALAEYTTLETMESRLTMTADSITSTVSQKVGKDEIISSINQSAESVKISASKVDITGFVTFSDLSTSGKTTINGSNITTGSISASLIKGGKLILRPSSTYTTAIEVQNSSGTKLIAIDGNGMTGYSGGAAPTFKLLGNEISFYRSSTVLTQIKDGDIYTAGKLYFTSGNSWAGTHIIEIGQTLSGAVLNVISGKTTLKATEIFASSGKALLITGNSSSYALHVTLGETVLQELTAGATSVSSLSASGAATIAGATAINNTLTVSAGSNGSDAVKVSTGRINAPVYYGALYATSSNLGFFGGSTNATKQSVSKLFSHATLANVITKVNDLLTALAKYNLITSY